MSANFVFSPKSSVGAQRGQFLFSFHAIMAGDTFSGGCEKGIVFVFLFSESRFTMLTRSTDSPSTSANDEKILEP